MATYGSRDKNPFNAPKTYKINGVDTASNLGTTKYYTLVEADGPNKGQITIKSPTVAGSLVGQFIPSQGANTDRTVGVITPGKPIVMTPGSATVDETRYFTSVVGQTAVKGQAQSTAQKAGLNPTQSRQLTTPNAATDPGTGAAAPTTPAPSAAVGAGAQTSGFGDFVYPTGLRKTKQDVIKFTMLEYKPSGVGAIQPAGKSNRGSLAGGIPEGRIIAGTVVLPIPNGISDTNSVDWGSDSMNAIQAAAAAAAMNTITGGFGKGMESAGESIKSFATEEVTKTGVGALFAGAAMSGEGAKILSRASGSVINPNLELLFNGPQLRPFQFTFKLSARNEDESKQIIKILNFFKRGMSPIKTESNLFLKAPNTFKIQYLHRPQGENADHPYIGRIKECALQSVTTSYTPEGQYATFTDGVMVSYQLTMQFQELEPVFNNDYADIEGIGF
jgi:hypothetical protein